MKGSIHPFPKMCKALNSSEIGCNPMGCLLTSTNVELLERTTNPYLACVLAACLLRVLYVCTIYFPIIIFKGFFIYRRSDQFYTWWTMESPPSLRYLRGLTLYEYDNVFNLTMSHRSVNRIKYHYKSFYNMIFIRY